MIKNFLLSCIDYFLMVVLYLLLGFFTVYSSFAILLFFLFWIGNIFSQFWIGRRLFCPVKSSAVSLIIVFLPPLIVWVICSFLLPNLIDFLLYPSIFLQNVLGGSSEIGWGIITALLQLLPLIVLWYSIREPRAITGSNQGTVL